MSSTGVFFGLCDHCWGRQTLLWTRWNAETHLPKEGFDFMLLQQQTVATWYWYRCFKYCVDCYFKCMLLHAYIDTVTTYCSNWLLFYCILLLLVVFVFLVVLAEHSEYSNIFENSNISGRIFDIRIQIYSNIRTTEKLGYEYIWLFVNFLRIYSNILLCEQCNHFSKRHYLLFLDSLQPHQIDPQVAILK